MFKPIKFLVTVVVGFAVDLWVLGHTGLGEIGKAVVESQVGTQGSC